MVDENNTVEKRDVKVGPKVNAFWIIREGLKPGEKVVYEGLQKVKDGAVVNPRAKEVNYHP